MQFPVDAVPSTVDEVLLIKETISHLIAQVKHTA